MNSRRSFLKRAAAIVATVAIGPIARVAEFVPTPVKQWTQKMYYTVIITRPRRRFLWMNIGEEPQYYYNVYKSVDDDE